MPGFYGSDQLGYNHSLHDSALYFASKAASEMVM